MNNQEAKEIIKGIDKAYRTFTKTEIQALEMAIKALEQEPITIYEIPKDYNYDTETKDFLVYRHKYTGDEIHIERPISLYRLDQWIPVSKRLSEWGEAVLTYHEDDEEYQINWVTDDETGEWFHENPTAWMPLPTPPNKSEILTGSEEVE